MSVGSSKSQSTSGYYDPNTQGSVDWLKQKTMGFNPETNKFEGVGLFGDYEKTAPTVFNKPSYQYQTPELKQTKVDPQMWQNYSDIITKNAKRTGAANIQKMQDQVAYQGRGGGDLADYRAAQENRSVADSVADQLKQLAAEKMGMEFQDLQGVNRFAAEGDLWRQEKQGGENLERDKAMLAEELGRKQNLNDLLKLIYTGTEAFARKPKSNSSSRSFGL